MKIKDFATISTYEELIVELVYLIHTEENEDKIRKWMDRPKIEIINYNETEHFDSPSDEIVLDVFLYSVNQVIKEEDLENQVLQKIPYYVLKKRDNNLDELKSLVGTISNYSILHISVLWFIYSLIN